MSSQKRVNDNEKVDDSLDGKKLIQNLYKAACGVDLNATEDYGESDLDNEEEDDDDKSFVEPDLFNSDAENEDDDDFDFETSDFSKTLVQKEDGLDTDDEIDVPLAPRFDYDKEYDFGDYHTPPAFRDGYVPSEKEEENITSFSRSRSPQSSFSSSYKRKAPIEESNLKSSKSLKPSNSPQKIIIQRESLRTQSALAGFRPPSDDFFGTACDYLRIPLTETQNSPLRNMKTFESITLPLTVTDVLGDGNCGYRALSHLIFGNDENHWLLRKRITEWRNFNEGPEGEACKQLELINEMERNNKKGHPVGQELWMGVYDIIAFCQLFYVNVFCYAKYIDAKAHAWHVYSPEKKNNYAHKPGYPDICIYFKDNHYQPVLKTNEQ